MGSFCCLESVIFGDWLLTDYSKWAGGIGTYMLEAFWHYNPDGYGFYVNNQQACEHFGKWIKNNRKACGSGNNDNYLFEIADNFDIYTLGRFLYDMIDLSDVVDEEVSNTVNKFNIYEIRKIHENILIGTPKLFRMYVKKLHELKVGGQVSPCLANIKKRDTHVYTKLNANLRNQLNNLMNKRSNEVGDEDSSQQSQAQHAKRHKKWRKRFKQRKEIARDVKKSI